MRALILESDWESPTYQYTLIRSPSSIFERDPAINKIKELRKKWNKLLITRRCDQNFELIHSKRWVNILLLTAPFSKSLQARLDVWSLVCLPEPAHHGSVDDLKFCYPMSLKMWRSPIIIYCDLELEHHSVVLTQLQSHNKMWQWLGKSSIIW